MLTSRVKNPYTPLRISEKKIGNKKKAELVGRNWFGNHRKKIKEIKNKNGFAILPDKTTNVQVSLREASAKYKALFTDLSELSAKSTEIT